MSRYEVLGTPSEKKKERGVWGERGRLIPLSPPTQLVATPMYARFPARGS